MKNARVTYSFRHNSILVKQIYYFGETLYLYRLMSQLRITNDYKRLRENINKHVKKYNIPE